MSHEAVPLAERMALVPFSGIRKVFERAKALERDGRPVIFLDIGRPDLDTPAHIKNAAKRALDAGEVHYTSNHGTPALRAAIAEKLRRDNGLSYDPETEILVTVGGAEAIYAVYLALTLLETAYLSLVPGPVLGESGQGYVRLSYANSYDRLADAVERIRRFCT